MSIKYDITMRHVIASLIICLFTAVICEISQGSPYVFVDMCCGAAMIVCVIVHGIRRYRDQCVLFTLLHKDAVLPSKNIGDAGYDIYAAFDEAFMIIEPHHTKMIPTGIASVFSPEYVAVLKERGSTGTKGLGQRAGVIDADYRGQWFVPLTNHNDEPMVIIKDDEDSINEFNRTIENAGLYTVYPYTKAIAQALFLQVPQLDIRRVAQATYDEKYAHTLRGAGMLGSTGK